MSRSEYGVINVPYRDEELAKVKCKLEGQFLALREPTVGCEMFRVFVGPVMQESEQHEIDRACESIEIFFKSTMQCGIDRYKRKHREFLGIENGR